MQVFSFSIPEESIVEEKSDDQMETSDPGRRAGRRPREPGK